MRRRAATLTVFTAVLATIVACADDGPSAAPDRSTAVEVFGPYLGVEADHFAAVLAAFTDATGIDVMYTGSADFSADLLQRSTDITSSPEVAIVPQPGLVAELAAAGHLVPLDDAAQTALADNYSDATRRFGTIDGATVAVPWRANVKSLVWYRPDVWSDNGWTVPQSLSELASLSLRIDGEPEIAPWCLTMRSGTATGWVATDWVEDLMIRTTTRDDYVDWARGDLAFDSDPVRDSFSEFQRLVLATGRLAGGTTAALSSPTREIFDGLLADPPTCAMAKQADFAASWLPEGTTIGPDGDIDFFVLPARAPGDDPPLLVGGDLAVALDASTDVAALMAYLAGPDAGVEWAREGGFLSPKSSFPVDEYRDDTTRELASRLTSAETVVIDASDQMPVEIGTDLFWSGITQWVGGGLSYDELAAILDDAFLETNE